jgi:hypothetical protein
MTRNNTIKDLKITNYMSKDEDKTRLERRV